MLVPGNEDGDPHHMQSRHTRGPRDRSKEASGFDFEYSSYIQLRLQMFSFFFLSLHL